MGFKGKITVTIILGLFCNLTIGYSLPTTEGFIEEATSTVNIVNEVRLLQDEITTEGAVANELVTASEDQFLDDQAENSPELQTTLGPVADDVVVKSLDQFQVANDEENELFREKRDAVTEYGVVVGNAEPEQTSVQPADDFPEFVRPTTPDPNVDETESGTGFDGNINLEELSKVLFKEGVNITREFVRGRSSCKCGTPADRIVGGTTASIREYPWTVGLTRGGRPYCGGSLINSHYIVTASHCVDGQAANRISVVIGEQDYNSAHDGATPMRYSVSKIIMHEHYNNKNIDNDIALLRLSQPVRLGGTNIPVCLPASNSNDFTGEKATVAGWGATSQGGSTSSHLRKVEVPVLSNTECNSSKSKYTGKITQNMLCAGYFTSGGKDSCQGDSGGPLTIENGGRRTLIGIVSWGYGCAQPYSPGVYTRVGRYPEWILSNTRGADWCQG